VHIKFQRTAATLGATSSIVLCPLQKPSVIAYHPEHLVHHHLHRYATVYWFVDNQWVIYIYNLVFVQFYRI